MTLKQSIGRVVFARMPITRFLFDQLRREVNCRTIMARNRLSPLRRRRLRRLRRRTDLLVNVASGPFLLPGFVNLDAYETVPGVVGWDCRRSLPFADASVAGIRAEHYVEHLETREELPAFLKDCLRVLKPGGALRIIVPDAQAFARAYSDKDLELFRDLGVSDPLPEDLPTPMDILNHVFHQWDEHRWGYDFESLAHRLRTAGFADVRRMSFRCSVLPELAQDREQHKPYSLYVDAVKQAK